MIKRFKEIPLTQRTIIWCEMIFGLFSGLTLFYLPLYQEYYGLTSIQIGQINSIGTVFACVATIFTGPIATKFPRRKVLIICDFIFWSVPILIWAFADSYIWFMLAACINAAGRVGMGAFQGMIHEDVPDALRPRIVSYVSTAYTVSSALTPLTALFFARYTLHGTLRTIFIIWFFCQTARNGYRFFFTVESDTGKKINERYRSLSLRGTTAAFFSSVPGILRDRNKVMFCALFAITQFLQGLTFVHVLYLSSHIMLAEGQYSLIPTIGAITSLAGAWIIPILRGHSEVRMTRSFYLVYLVGCLLFILLPKQNFLVFVVAAILFTGGSFLTQVLINSSQMNYLKEDEKTMVYSLFQTIAVIFCIPAGYAGGTLFAIRPWLPYCLIAVLILCSMLILTLLNRSLAQSKTGDAQI